MQMICLRLSLARTMHHLLSALRRADAAMPTMGRSGGDAAGARPLLPRAGWGGARASSAHRPAGRAGRQASSPQTHAYRICRMG